MSIHKPNLAKTFTAPTLYIAASGEYNKYSTTLDVKGASNLPPGSRLEVELADFVGYKSSILSEDRSVVLNKDGFFEITPRPLAGKQFKDNMVCEISFIPHDFPQDPSVLKVVGKNGELLGIENDPQVHKNSGGYYLQAIVHIPRRHEPLVNAAEGAAPGISSAPENRNGNRHR